MLRYEVLKESPNVARWRLRWPLFATLILVIFTGALRSAGPFLVVSAPPYAPDAIVSLASHEWERLPEAARLARRYPRATVLLTTPVHVTDHNCHRCGDRLDILVREGVHPARIHVLASRVTNTRDEAASCRTYALDAKPTEIVVVTSPYHTRRALAMFRGMFRDLPTRIAIVPASASSPARPHGWWRTRYDRAYVVYEWAAMFYYAVRFGVHPWSE